VSSSATPQDFIVVARTLARPLNEHYGHGYLSRHLNIHYANARLDAKQKLDEFRGNSVIVAGWEETSFISISRALYYGFN
jgi:hypothetical protein